MMCFRDMTFCNALCGNTECQIKMTDKVMADAQRWWGSDKAPIAVSDFSQTCAEYVPEVK